MRNWFVVWEINAMKVGDIIILSHVVTSSEDLVEKVQVFIFLETMSLLNAEIEMLQVAWNLQ